MTDPTLHSANLEVQCRTLTQLAQITQNLFASLHPQTIFQTATQQIGIAFESSRCVLLSYDSTPPDTCALAIVAEYGEPSVPSVLGHSLSINGNSHLQKVLDQDHAVICDRMDESLLLSNLQDSHTGMPIQSMMAIRTSYQGLTNGVIALHQCDRPRTWSADEVKLLEAVAIQVGIAIAHAHLLEQEKRQRTLLAQQHHRLQQESLERKRVEHTLARQLRREVLLGQITQAIRYSLDTQKILETAAMQIGQTFAVSRCLIYGYSAYPNPELQIPLVAEYLVLDCPSLLQTHLPLDDLHAQILTNRDEVVSSANVFVDPWMRSVTGLCEQIGLKSMLAIRTSFNGKPNGVIGLHQCDRLRDWTPDELDLLKDVAAQMGIALAQSHRLEQEKLQRKELESAKQAAELANQSKSQFLANMSHELRTPLNAILGFSQLLQRDVSLTPQQQKILNTINRSGAHLLQLINDVLEMSKIEAGQGNLKIEAVNLHKLIQSLQEMLRLKAEAKGLQLKMETGTIYNPHLRTDTSKLRQVLINLLENAIKFTERGQVILRVWQEKTAQTPPVAIEDAPKNVKTIWFEVEDTGPGMTELEVQQIFEAFTQAKAGRQANEGTGLGLTICRKYVQMLGGDITVTSQPGQGSTLRFFIHAVVDPVVEHQYSQKMGTITLADPQTQYRILVVEDQPESRQLLSDLLENAGFTVKTATNGKEAIACWQIWRPHLIWMDMQMPIMDGGAATQYIKSHAGEQSPCIIALTASVFDQDRARALAHGCDDFVGKPFRMEEIWSKLRQHLGVTFTEQRTPPSGAATVSMYRGHPNGDPLRQL